MTGGALQRGLAILECLVGHPSGLALATISSAVDIPKTVVHRVLNDLVTAGFARQDRDTGNYLLSIKLPALALQHLAQVDLVAMAKPTIEALASQSSEHVRLGLVDDEKLVFVAHAQGSIKGLRYNPEAGGEPPLYYTATGLAWLSGFTDEKAMELVSRQGIGDPKDHGPNAPTSVHDFLERLHRARADGYAIADQSNELGISGIAMPVRNRGQVVSVLTIVGPSLRLTQERLLGLLPLLKEACDELAVLNSEVISQASPFRH